MTHEGSLFVDLYTDEMDSVFDNAPIFEKVVTIHARQVTEVTRIETIVADGFFETSQVVQSGDWIITNPDNEIYSIPHQKFIERYESIGDGLYRAVGRVQAVRNPWSALIKIMAPWGTEQFGNEVCYIARTFGTSVDDRYIIEEQAFSHTYQLLS